MLLYLVSVKVRIKLVARIASKIKREAIVIIFGGCAHCRMQLHLDATASGLIRMEFIVSLRRDFCLICDYDLACDDLELRPRAEEPGSEKYLLLIAFLIGLSMSGVHQMSMLGDFSRCGEFVYLSALAARFVRLSVLGMSYRRHSRFVRVYF